MPNIKSAIKRVSVIEKKTLQNNMIKNKYYYDLASIIDDYINKLNGIKIPFKNFKIIIVMTGTGNEYLNQIKLYKKLRPASKLINKKRYNIYYDNIQKRIYLIFNSNKIRNLIVNKLDKYQEPYGITNSLEDIKERT